jgi:hypothetical protein
MNKENEEFQNDNNYIITNLIRSLDILLDKFEQEIVPGNPEKSNALYMLGVYEDAMAPLYRNDEPAFKRITAETSLIDEKMIYSELLGIKDSLSLLVRLVRENIIEIDDVIFQSDVGKSLLNAGYCDEVILEESGNHYYTLSMKSEKILRNKNLVKMIGKDNIMLDVPNEMIFGADKWSNLYVRRVEILKQYYGDKKENKEYIVFTLDEEKEMVFGCELNDSLDVTYTFAGVFDDKIDKHIKQLKVLAGSGLIDNIIILINSNEIGEMLENAGINQTHHILIERL